MVLGDRGLPSWAEAVLRGGAGAGPRGEGAAQPHRAGDPGVPAAGASLLHHWGQLVRGQSPDHPRRGPGVPRQASVRIDMNRVTPIVISDSNKASTLNKATCRPDMR